MLRNAVKFPYNGITLTRLRSHGTSRLYLASRYQSTGKGGGGGGSTFLYVVGTVTLTTGGTIAYAKYDPEFRQWLGSNVPYSEELIKAVLQEESNFSQPVFDLLNNVKSTIWSLFESKPQEPVKEDIKHEIKKIPPAPVEKVHKVVVKKEKRLEPEVVTGKTAKIAHSLADLESKIGDATTLAISSYKKATTTLRDLSQDIHLLLEDSFQNLDPNIWSKIKEKSDIKEKLVKEAESTAKEAVASIKRMKHMLDEGPIDAPADIVESSKRNIQKALEDVDKALSNLNSERKRASITNKYWGKVEEARKHWMEEMQILFPGVNLLEKDLKVSQRDLDLFIVYAFQNVLFYQKELKKLETLGERRLNAALSTKGEGADQELIKAQVEAEISKEKRELEVEFNKRCLAMRVDGERDLRLQMKRQAAAHADHLQDAVAAKEKEVDRLYKRMADEVIAAEQAKYKQQLAAMLGRLRGMDTALKARADADKNAHQSQVLWSACQALYSALRNSSPGQPWVEQLRPLAPEIGAVKHAAPQEDELVSAVLKGIPKEAIDRGVFTEDALRERFLKVERIARQVALVPEGGGSIPLFFLSYLQSFLLIRAVSPIPQAELVDEPVNFDNLDTYDILQRARYWLDRGDFSMTLRYLNLLKGASRRVAHDWMNEARILLETQQAANTLMAHASASGLLYL